MQYGDFDLASVLGDIRDGYSRSLESVENDEIQGLSDRDLLIDLLNQVTALKIQLSKRDLIDARVHDLIAGTLRDCFEQNSMAIREIVRRKTRSKPVSEDLPSWFRKLLEPEEEEGIVGPEDETGQVE